MENNGRILLLAAVLILFSVAEISSVCYRRCHKDYNETCNISGHKCAKTISSGFKCMPIESIDECASNPCQNGGTCTDKYDGYNCSCPEEHFGTNCHITWVLAGNMSYLMHGEIFLNYTESVEFCESLGAHTVAAETPEENEVIKDIIRTYDESFGNSRERYYWLGLTNHNGSYLWDYTGQAPTYEDWAAFVSYGGGCSSYGNINDFAWVRDCCNCQSNPVCERSSNTTDS